VTLVLADSLTRGLFPRPRWGRQNAALYAGLANGTFSRNGGLISRPAGILDLRFSAFAAKPLWRTGRFTRPPVRRQQTWVFDIRMSPKSHVPSPKVNAWEPERFDRFVMQGSAFGVGGPAVPSGLRRHRAEDPALKRRAIVGLSLRGKAPH
jgi:hypothetical protein